MNIDPVYLPLYQQARVLQNQFHDAVGTTEHPTAFALRQEMQHLQDDLEIKKNPRDIENRIKVIQHQLLQAQNDGASLMSFEHADHFHRGYEDLRRDVRRLSAYN